MAPDDVEMVRTSPSDSRGSHQQEFVSPGIPVSSTQPEAAQPPNPRARNQSRLAANGYPSLAAFQSSDEAVSIYRRYSYLQSRLLLEKQDQLRELEDRLDAHDEQDVSRYTRQGLDPDQASARHDLLKEIENALMSYCTIRLATSLMIIGIANQRYSKRPRYLPALK
jgi:hypothetical protein